MKKVSIVVPCYNMAAYLGQCVESLVNQTIGIENLEIILVNDASTDDGQTWKKITEIERTFPDTVIAISLEENLRQGGARNIGISYASGEYLMFCDADDWLALEAAECLYQRAKEYDADVVEYRMESVWADTDLSALSTEEGEESHLLILDNEDIKKRFYLTSTETCSLGCMRKFYRMSLIKNHNIRFAEHLIFEEPSFTLPVRLYEKRHYQLDQLLYFYGMTPGSTSRGSWDDHRLDSMKVWKILLEDLKARGFLQKYHEEIEYLFYCWGYWLSIRMLLQKGYSVSTREIKYMVQEVLDAFPGVRKNKYLEKPRDAMVILLKTVLDMELTEESVRAMNEILKKYV